MTLMPCPHCKEADCHGRCQTTAMPIPPRLPVRYAIERVSDQEWRIVRDGAYVMARCAFVQDADIIVKALREAHRGTP